MNILPTDPHFGQEKVELSNPKTNIDLAMKNVKCKQKLASQS